MLASDSTTFYRFLVFIFGIAVVVLGAQEVYRRAWAKKGLKDEPVQATSFLQSYHGDMSNVRTNLARRLEGMPEAARASAKIKSVPQEVRDNNKEAEPKSSTLLGSFFERLIP